VLDLCEANYAPVIGVVPFPVSSAEALLAVSFRRLDANHDSNPQAKVRQGAMRNWGKYGLNPRVLFNNTIRVVVELRIKYESMHAREVLWRLIFFI
jgi:hypothetical protein